VRQIVLEERTEKNDHRCPRYAAPNATCTLYFAHFLVEVG